MKNILVITGLLICFLASGQNAKEEYNYSKRISMGCKMVVKDNAFGILDKEGELILPLEYEDIDFFSNGYVIVRKNKKNGLFSLSDKKIIIPIEYGDIEKLKKGKKGFRAYGRNYQVKEFSFEGKILKEYFSKCKYHNT